MTLTSNDGKWRGIEDKPDHPVQVEFFMGNAPAELLVEPYRDERRYLGYWDGEEWRDCGTGHRTDERRDFDNGSYYPTHYRILAASPDPVASDETTTSSQDK